MKRYAEAVSYCLCYVSSLAAIPPFTKKQTVRLRGYPDASVVQSSGHLLKSTV